MDVLGSEMVAWLGWFFALPGSLLTKAASMNVACVGVVISILAILAGFGTAIYQNRHADRVQEAERARRAEVVAYRLSVWLSEVGTSVERALGECRDSRANLSGSPAVADTYLTRGLRMNTATNIDDLLPDLHYLLAGSGDIAQLDQLIRSYKAWLVRDGVASKAGTPSELIKVCDDAERQLRMISTLHANAERPHKPSCSKGD